MYGKQFQHRQALNCKKSLLISILTWKKRIYIMENNQLVFLLWTFHWIVNFFRLFEGRTHFFSSLISFSLVRSFTQSLYSLSHWVHPSHKHFSVQPFFMFAYNITIHLCTENFIKCILFSLFFANSITNKDLLKKSSSYIKSIYVVLYSYF